MLDLPLVEAAQEPRLGPPGRATPAAEAPGPRAAGDLHGPARPRGRGRAAPRARHAGEPRGGRLHRRRSGRHGGAGARPRRRRAHRRSGARRQSRRQPGRRRRRRARRPRRALRLRHRIRTRGAAAPPWRGPGARQALRARPLVAALAELVRGPGDEAGDPARARRRAAEAWPTRWRSARRRGRGGGPANARRRRCPRARDRDGGELHRGPRRLAFDRRGGRSHAFERGYVVYSDAAKASALGVPGPLIAAEGAVSRAVAIAMAEGAGAVGRRPRLRGNGLRRTGGTGGRGRARPFRLRPPRRLDGPPRSALWLDRADAGAARMREGGDGDDDGGDPGGAAGDGGETSSRCIATASCGWRPRRRGC